MKKIKVMSIFGTRPEAIKMAPLVKKLEAEEEIESIVCITAQHREMLDQVLDLFAITAKYDLDIMSSKQTLSGIATKVLSGLDDILQKEQPDMILVHGDTSTTFCAALSAYYHQIQVGHVEAGLRTYDKYQPFPEEANRQLTSVLTDLHFAPTPLAKSQLLKENVSENKVFITGNTVIDALQHTVEEDYVFSLEALNAIDYNKERVITVTAHRRENLGEPLLEICNAIRSIVETFPDVSVVYPVHKNPLVMEPVHNILGELERVHLIEPLDLKDMHNLLSRSYLVMTDSGGLQEEVPSLGKPVLVLRNVTERPEGIEAGTLRLVGTDQNTIVKATNELLTNTAMYEAMAQAKNPFGDGTASERIVQNILYHFGKQSQPSEEYIIKKE
ncbi:MAG: UDP-N-acetylglucosamine 2-epimerase (non-hydrolyzing) [Bacillota bacterium]